MSAAEEVIRAKPLALIIGAAYTLNDDLKDMEDYRTLVSIFQSVVRINNALVDIFFALEAPEVERNLKVKTTRAIGVAIEKTTPEVSILVAWLSSVLQQGYFLSPSDIDNVVSMITKAKQKINSLQYAYGIAEAEMYRVGPQLKRFNLGKQFQIIERSTADIRSYGAVKS